MRISSCTEEAAESASQFNLSALTGIAVASRSVSVVPRATGGQPLHRIVRRIRRWRGHCMPGSLGGLASGRAQQRYKLPSCGRARSHCYLLKAATVGGPRQWVVAPHEEQRSHLRADLAARGCRDQRRTAELVDRRAPGEDAQEAHMVARLHCHRGCIELRRRSLEPDGVDVPGTHTSRVRGRRNDHRDARR